MFGIGTDVLAQLESMMRILMRGFGGSIGFRMSVRGMQLLVFTVFLVFRRGNFTVFFGLFLVVFVVELSAARDRIHIGFFLGLFVLRFDEPRRKSDGFFIVHFCVAATGFGLEFRRGH